jgi:hypothetical protein
MTGVLLLALSCIPREDPPEKVLHLDEISILPQVLSENSGLTSSGGLIWFINDSGNEPEIYGYSREENSVQKTLFVKGALNIDWEDITQNEEYIFIGDFGNNSGNRTDLNIICLDIDDLFTVSDTIVPVGRITFRYEDQTDFSGSPEDTPFDCEAFIANQDTIFLFTKDWVTQQTRIYTVPATPGDYDAEFVDQWDIEGLITSAAWSDQTDQLILLGYTPIIPFIWVYTGFNANTLKFDAAERTDFSNYISAQTEGIMITETGTVVISSEANATLGTSARLYILRED